MMETLQKWYDSGPVGWLIMAVIYFMLGWITHILFSLISVEVDEDAISMYRTPVILFWPLFLLVVIILLLVIVIFGEKIEEDDEIKK